MIGVGKKSRARIGLDDFRKKIKWGLGKSAGAVVPIEGWCQAGVMGGARCWGHLIGAVWKCCRGCYENWFTARS